MSENIHAAIGYVDDIPMPKLAKPAALLSFTPRARILVQKLRRIAYKSERSREESDPYIGALAG